MATVKYRTIDDINNELSYDIPNALYIKLGGCELKISERDGVLRISGESSLQITPVASNVIEITEPPFKAPDKYSTT